MSRISILVVGVAVFVAAAFAAACTADIGTGSYYCGSNAICPTGQTCDGSSNTCVFPGEELAFSCATPDTTETFTGLTCISPTQSVTSCLGSAGDSGQFTFTVPATCTAVEADARVAFPIAFGNVDVEIDAMDGTVVATDGQCTGETGDGSAARCVSTTHVTPGDTYVVNVALSSTGAGDCNGDCAYNKYALTFQLEAP